MQYTTLGTTQLKVSRICLGTMTWGQQNSEAEAHEQLDYALEQGINFVDTAEMYPVPPRAETQGRTEAYIGSWLKNRADRDRIILATKVAGPSRNMGHIRPEMRLDRANIVAAIETSLRRLQTDYVDLYQLHWPDRNVNCFGQLGYVHQQDEQMTPLLESLEVLGELVDDGKVRYIGVSNESPWGVMTCLHLAEQHGLPVIQSIQNPYNLLNRSFEVGLAEVAMREGVGLLAYSPLAFGTLSGKYLDAQPENARVTLFERFVRYSRQEAVAATRDYVALARAHGLDPAQMALAFVNSRPFVASNIIGATTMDQLAADIASIDLELPEAVVTGIEAIHAANSNPAP